MSKKKEHWTERHPYLLDQWHPTKNGDITPENCRFKAVVWWHLPYDDPETGKHFDFEWPAKVADRTRGAGCPFLAGRKVWPGYNDLAAKRPNLAKEWHPTKNGDKTPESVTCDSPDKVWWYLPYDDPETGKHFDFEWPARVADRTKGSGCPFLAGQKLWPGYNDLATKRPDLAKEWHPAKNGDKTPESVTCGSPDKVWWYLSYDDPETGKHFDFEWQAQIKYRNNRVGCPFLSGRKVWPGYNDLSSKRPDLAKQWHPTKNGEKTPDSVTCGSRDKVWWYLPYDDPENGKHFDFEWQAQVKCRNNGVGCPFLSGKKVWPGYNDLATKHPDLAKQWHPTKNGEKTPSSVTCGSGKKVWWYLPYDDPETGKHFDFEWQANISRRTIGDGCPFLSGEKVWPGYNDLATKHPDLAKQWHPTKNGDKTPESVTCWSADKVWWYLPFDDPKTGKHFDFEWPARVYNRMNGNGCPFLVGKEVWPGYNDLATKRPGLAKQWHPTKNGNKTPESVTCSSDAEVWWYLPFDDPETGKHFDFEWPARIADRTKGVGCPFLSGKDVWPGFNDLATKRPDLAAQWHPTKNGDKTPESVTCGSNDKVWWYLPFDDPETGKHFDFEWEAAPNDRVAGNGCPFLSGKDVWPGYNDLATCFFEVTREWHPTKNRKKTPDYIYKYERTPKRWWRCNQCGHEWRDYVCSRTIENRGCPKCRKEKAKYC